MRLCPACSNNESYKNVAGELIFGISTLPNFEPDSMAGVGAATIPGTTHGELLGVGLYLSELLPGRDRPFEPTPQP